jgi:hypothetical protein
MRGAGRKFGTYTARTGCALIQGFFSREPVIFNHLQALSQNRSESDQGLRGQAAVRAADFFLFFIRCRAWPPGGRVRSRRLFITDRWPRGADFCGNYRNLFLCDRSARSLANRALEIGSRMAGPSPRSRGNAEECTGGKRSKGVGGLNLKREAFRLPHLVSCADFFLVQRPLIYFLEIKDFKRLGGEFFRRNSAHRSDQSPLSTIYFPGQARSAHSKNCREIPPGGGEGAMPLRGKHE